MKDPFKHIYHGSTSYTEFIEKQLIDLDVGESKEINIGEKSLRVFRATVNYISNSNDRKYKTRTGENNSMWAIRIK